MSDLSANQEKAISALLSEATLTAAATKAGVTDRTLRRWLAEDTTFIEAYQQARQRKEYESA